MSSTKVKKVRKYRASKTHGGGSMKKRRGAGSRGGRGRAGSGKRNDSQKPSYWKTWTLGNKGFTSQTRKDINTLNVSDLDRALDSFVSAGKAEKKGNNYVVDLAAVGVHKLLGSGHITSAVTVTVDAASPKAVEKVAAAGGSVSVNGAEESQE